MNLISILFGSGAAIIALTVHELGHLVSGLLVGFRFSFLAIGPLLLERTPSNRFRLALNRFPSFFGGAAATYPVDTNVLASRFARVVAGGPIASLILAISAGAGLAILSPSVPRLRMELEWLCLISFLIFLGTIIPIRNGPFVTDGLRVLRILRRGDHGDRELALITLTGSQFGGIRPRDWDYSLIGLGLQLHDGSIFECQMYLYSYFHALDAGSFDEARNSLHHALDIAPGMPSTLKADCFLEATFFEAAYQRCPAIARQHFASAPKRALGVLECDRLRALAAVAVAERDFRKAKEHIARALLCAPSWATGQRAWLTDLLAITDGHLP